ncbi:MAG: hypothetical protein BWY59_00572 [Verrucomicrobia bacterium ADurb.Bin345]|nr:MAG: hypothetical protein BWY59_00572 [Verrucomicrobia bacterium ADurb.Bin345]
MHCSESTPGYSHSMRPGFSGRERNRRGSSASCPIQIGAASRSFSWGAIPGIRGNRSEASGRLAVFSTAMRQWAVETSGSSETVATTCKSGASATPKSRHASFRAPWWSSRNAYVKDWALPGAIWVTGQGGSMWRVQRSPMAAASTKACPFILSVNSARRPESGSKATRSPAFSSTGKASGSAARDGAAAARIARMKNAAHRVLNGSGWR